MTQLLVVHSIPGRMRLRVPADGATEGLAEAILREPGVVGSSWSPRTRSLLVRYGPDQADAATIVDTVARLTGAEIADRDVAGPAVEAGDPGRALGAGLGDAARVLDERVQQLTRGTIGLAGLLPAALIGWALAEVVRGRTGPLTWSTALWYAHGLYRDYSAPPSRD